MTFLSTYTKSGLFKDLVNSEYLSVLTQERYEGSIRDDDDDDDGSSGGDQ